MNIAGSRDGGGEEAGLVCNSGVQCEREKYSVLLSLAMHSYEIELIDRCVLFEHFFLCLFPPRLPHCE